VFWTRRYQTADEFAHALRAAKDPTWQGQVKDATIRIEARTQTSSLPPVQSHAAATAAVPTPKPARSNVALIVTVVGVIGLGALAGGGFLLYQRLSGSKPALASVEPPADPPETLPVPETPKVTLQVKPLALPEPQPPLQTLPQPTPIPLPKSLPLIQLPPPVITENPPVAKPAQPKPAQPDPEPPTASSLPIQEQKNLANVSLSEAIRLADSDPNRAIEGLRKAIAADPGSTNAYAWLAVILYEQGRYQEIPGVIAKARQQGIPRARLMSNMRFRMIMQNDRLNHRIPGGAGGDE
jgi:hypothetical protein